MFNSSTKSQVGGKLWILERMNLVNAQQGDAREKTSGVYKEVQPETNVSCKDLNKFVGWLNFTT